jgi:hypothetical protein
VLRLYTCPQFLTDVGFDIAALNLGAAGIYNLIHEVSSIIDSLTDQWFNAEHGTYEFNGGDRALVQHSHQIPFVSVDSIAILGDRTNYRGRSYSAAVNAPMPAYDQSRDGPIRSGMLFGGVGTLSSTEYVVHNRALERVRSPFPGGAKNVQVVGALGWIEDAHYYTTTTTADITNASTSVTVTDASEFEYRDVVDIVAAAGSLRAVVTSVTKATNTVTFGTAFGARFIPDTLAAGATIRTFGKVPRGIELVANYLVGGAIREFQARQADNDNPLDPARIKRERTDDYEYELFSASDAKSIITGNAKFDSILSGFARPGGVRVV